MISLRTAPGKDRSAESLMVVTSEGGALVLYALAAPDLTAHEVARLDLGGRSFNPGDGVASIIAAVADSFVVKVDDTTALATSQAAGRTVAFPSMYLSDLVIPYSDGTGFTSGEVLSVNLLNGVFANNPDEPVLTNGYHVQIDASSLDEARMALFRNHGTQRVSDGALQTWRADLSSPHDEVSSDEALVVEGFAWENGICGLLRLGVGYGPWGAGSFSSEGDHAWDAAPSVVHIGRCDGEGKAILRELRFDGPTWYYHGDNLLKVDIPVFGVTEGEALYDGYDDLFDGMDRFKLLKHGWGLDAQGKPHALWSNAQAVLVPRRGTTMWTYKDNAIHQIKADVLTR